MAPEISIQKNAQRICVYIGESDRWRGKALYTAILEVLKAKGIAGATVTRGVAGFGAHSRIHTAAILRLSEDLPLRIEVIDSPAKIAEALDAITPMVREGLITVDDVEVIRYTHRYLNPLPADKHVSEVMTREVVTLRPQMTLAQAWEMMLKHLLKAMPVVNELQEVVGMLTDEDLLCCVRSRPVLAVKIGRDVLSEELQALHESKATVADVMSKPVITAFEKEPLGIAAARMAKHNLKRLPVLDDAGQLVGVLSRRDVLGQLLQTASANPMPSISLQAARTVEEVMHRPIPSVNVDASLAEVVDALLEAGLRRVIVVDNEMRPLGLISDGDVVLRVAPQEQKGVLAALRRLGRTPLSQATAQMLMSPEVLTAAPQTPLVKAAERMLAEHRKWLVVVDEAGKALGLVDRQILLKAIAGD